MDSQNQPNHTRKKLRTLIMPRRPPAQKLPRQTPVGHRLAGEPGRRDLPHDKRPLDLDLAFKRIERAITPYKKAAMFGLRDQGYSTLFQQLIACVISIRTLDEMALPISIRLLTRAPTPQAMAKLSTEKINELIHGTTFSYQKAQRIREISKIILKEYDGHLPADADVLKSLPGIGPKCAHLALGVACNLPFISVDIHVHRVVNRWGYVLANTPEKTLKRLEPRLPREHWIDINRLLVPFGKHICTGFRPHCSTCPVLEMCRQVGVKNPR
jgi:endonuclease III